MIERSEADNDWNWKNILRNLIEEEVISFSNNAIVRIRKNKDVPYHTVCEKKFATAMTRATRGHEGRREFFHREEIYVLRCNGRKRIDYAPMPDEEFLDGN